MPIAGNQYNMLSSRCKNKKERQTYSRFLIYTVDLSVLNGVLPF